jgi:hypothetical protein
MHSKRYDYAQAEINVVLFLLYSPYQFYGNFPEDNLPLKYRLNNIYIGIAF